MNVLMRLLTLSKIRRAIRSAKYIIIGIKLFMRDVYPIIRLYIENVRTLIKDIRQTELLEEKKNDSNIKKK